MQLIKIKCKNNYYVNEEDKVIYLLPYKNNLNETTFLELFENAWFPVEHKTEQKILCLLINKVIFNQRIMFLINYNSNLYYFYFIPEEHEVEVI